MDNEELEIWKALNELPEVKKVFGAWRYGDFYTLYGSIYQIDEDDTDYDKHKIIIGKDEVWISPLFDPVRPERSLWYLSREIRGNWTPSDKILFAIRKRPDLALAKAILEQKEKG